MERKKSKIATADSPGKKVWKRFKSNGPAFVSLLFVCLAIFVSVFAYTFIPDNTPLSNRMNLALSNQSPGFEVQLIKIPKSNVVSENYFSQIFFGAKDNYDFIPVVEAKISGSQIIFQEFTGDDSQVIMDSLNLILIAVPVKEKTIIHSDGSIISAIGTNNILHQFSITELKEKFYNESLIHKKFYFGTDRYGRDLLSRILAGTRVTFGVGLVAVLISLFVGLILGSLAGFFRGRIDQFVLWLINVTWSIPTLLLVIAITLVMGKGFEQVFIAVGLTMWVEVARIVRSQLFAVRELEYVTAGKALGYRSSRIIIFHMLPNIVGPVLVVAAANFSTAILLEAGLSFLGIGAQPPTPSWGAMIKENYGYIIIPGSAYLAILPGVAIMMMTMAFTFVANGLRDAFDAK